MKSITAVIFNFCFIGAVLCLYMREAAANPRLNASVEITTAPAYGTTEDVAGRVSGVNPAEYRVAVCVYVGDGWWTKPTFAQPSVAIGSDGNWVCDITTGGDDIHSTRIAAFAVPASFSVPLCSGRTALPNELYAAAAAYAFAYRGPYDRILSFAGYSWRVKQSSTPTGPGPNLFSGDPSDVFVDGAGLHLKIVQHAGQWYSTELILERTLGYGTYLFQTTGRLDTLDPMMVAGLFTWDPTSPGQNYREFDFEFSRWGDSGDPTNAQFVVQPFATPGNLVRYRADLTDADPRLTLVFAWRPGVAIFKAVRGHVSFVDLPAGEVVHSWTYSGPDAAPPGEENVRVNFWLYNGAAPVSGLGSEFVVTGFQYVPPGLAEVATEWQLLE